MCVSCADTPLTERAASVRTSRAARVMSHRTVGDRHVDHAPLEPQGSLRRRALGNPVTKRSSHAPSTRAASGRTTVPTGGHAPRRSRLRPDRSGHGCAVRGHDPGSLQRPSAHEPANGLPPRRRVKTAVSPVIGTSRRSASEHRDPSAGFRDSFDLSNHTGLARGKVLVGVLSQGELRRLDRSGQLRSGLLRPHRLLKSRQLCERGMQPTAATFAPLRLNRKRQLNVAHTS